MENSIALGVNAQYIQQTEEYNKIDALLAFILYIFVTLGCLLLGKLFVWNNLILTETYIFYTTGAFSLSCIGIAFLFCLFQKQKLATMGFNMDQAKKSLVMGMFLFAVTVVLGGIWAVLTGSTIQTDIKVIAMRIIYFQIFIGFYEELVFRGYIGTRLYGYFSNKQISIVITGIMFSLMHVPFHMTVAQMGFIEYILMHWINLVFLVIFHCGFQWLYSKYNSIIAPTILHFIIDFIQWFIIA